MPHSSSWERRGKICQRNNSADTKVSEEVEGSAPASRAEILLQPAVRPWWCRLSLYSPQRSKVEQIFTLHFVEDPMPEQVDVPWRKLWPCRDTTLEQGPGRNCGPWRGAHAGAVFLAGSITPWGTHNGAVHSCRTAPCGKDPCWKSLWRTVSCELDPKMEQGKSMRRKDRQRPSTMNWL